MYIPSHGTRFLNFLGILDHWHDVDGRRRRGEFRGPGNRRLPVGPAAPGPDAQFKAKLVWLGVPAPPSASRLLTT